jgi:SAM-dependent methyltransferase
MAQPDPVAQFISRWSKAEAAERANYQLFLSELCDLLAVPRPEPAGGDTTQNAYVFERAVTFHHRGTTRTSTGRIDLYKRGSFVLEAKQYTTAKAEPTDFNFDLGDSAPKTPKIARGTAAWDDAMLKALGQADRYARSLPADEDPPPFLLVVDVGHVIELHADFTQKGKNYQPFPDARSHRIKLTDLTRAEVRDLLQAVWNDPVSLDPSKKAAAVTREVAGYLAELAKSFEKNHDPKLVAEFLSRCLFCMFAEDVGLLPKDGFKGFLDSIKDDPGAFAPLAEQLFADMNEGRVSGLLRKKLLYFNGGLFAQAKALPVNGTQLGLLRKAASLEWRHVEPAIFGTLLERALSPDERHKLGAHYTPRAYVERLVLPTLIEPLREEWSDIRIAAVTLAQRDTAADLKQARAEVRKFHERLCALRVLDPACGSGNFLYVALEQMKRLEGEVIALLRDFGETDVLALQGVTVDPHQFLGIEINPRAAAIAELVLWIGYLQWHFRVHGDAAPAEPVLRKFNNIENRDAVLAYDEKGFLANDGSFCSLSQVKPASLRYAWDRKTTKTDSVTGREVPDDKAVVALDAFRNPRPADWPQADFIVGNPPFLGSQRMREDLGDGYTETLRAAYPEVPESADFVMFWWHKAANETLAKRTRRFGLITTNSLRQVLNRQVVQSALVADLSLIFAIPDHPWIDSSECAAVRIAMTVGLSGANKPGALYRVIAETPDNESGENNIQLSTERGVIRADLNVGADVANAAGLRGNEGVAVKGFELGSQGFLVPADEAKRALERHASWSAVLKPYMNGDDLTEGRCDRYVIDFFGFSQEEARRYPDLFNRVAADVQGDRKGNREDRTKAKWWLFRRSGEALRNALSGLHRFIGTTRTARKRVFQFLPAGLVAESKIVVIASSDAFHLGVLSSAIHVLFATTAGGWLGVGNDPTYNHVDCFNKFPFPDCTEKQKERIRKLAEELDAHRKRAQAKHQLGLTDIYSVLEKLRAGEALTAKDKVIHDAALVSTLKQQHDDLDQAVADAYSWSWPLSDAEILERVVALNAQRADEEAKGHIRWLRPDYQKPLFAGEKQSSLGLDENAPDSKSGGPKKQKSAGKPKKAVWPKSIAERAKVVEAALAAAEQPITAADLAKQFSRAKDKEVTEILDTLCALGRAHQGDITGTYVR